MPKIVVPYCHFTLILEKQIHIFTDTSTLAYEAVAYCRIISNSCAKVLFIIRNLRLASLNEKSLAILKLELQAVVIASRLKLTFLKENQLNLPRIFFKPIQKLS